MPEEVLFKSESTQSREEIADYLRAVADRLSANEAVTLSAGRDSVSLEVPDRPTFEVKVERETDSGGGNAEQSLELEIEWPEDGSADGTDGQLSVE